MDRWSEDPGSGGPRVWVPGRRLLTAGLILLVTLVASESLAIATVMPLVEQDLGDLALYGWVFSGFFLGNLVGIVAAGRAADRVRPDVPLVAGLALFVAGLAIGGAAPSMAALVAGRVVQGIGAGAIPAVAYVCIARAYPPEARPRMFALLSTAWVIPSLIGPGLSGLVGQQLGWRWVLLGLLPLVVVAGALAAVAVRDVRRPDEPIVSGPSMARAAQLVLGAGLLLAGLDLAPSLVSLPVALAGLAIGVDAFARLTPAGTLRARPGLPATVIVKLVFMASFFAVDTYIPLAVTSQKGVDATYAGAIITVTSLVWTAGSWIQERRVRHAGPRPLVATGFSCIVAGAALLAVVLVPAVPVALAFLGGAVLGLGAGLTYAPLSAATLASAERGHEGAATSATQLAEVLGIALGSGIGGVVIAATESAGAGVTPGVVAVYVGAGVLAIAGTLLAVRLPPSVVDTAARGTSSTAS
ncbi:MAG: MFS transporter [Acidimicrobiales bacterium]